MSNNNIIKIAFVGDIMPGGILHGTTSKFISNDVLDYLSQFDLRIGTLEAAVGDNFEFDKEKMEVEKTKNIIYVKNNDLNRLSTLNINVVSLANNHIYDLGKDGLQNTIYLLDKMGILHCGAGIDTEDTEMPAIVEIKEKKIAFLSYLQYGWVASHPPTKETPGINILHKDKVIKEINKAKRLYDYVFILPHWGREFYYFPSPNDKRIAYEMLRAGADGVIGSHSHQIQPYVTYKEKPIFFSLGNFMFFDFYMQPPRPIWYPDKKVDTTKLRVTYEYEAEISEPVKRIWKDIHRIGMIADVNLSPVIEAKYKLSYLTKENKITFLESQNKHRLMLTFAGNIIKSPLFNLTYSAYCFFRRYYWFIRRHLFPPK